MKFGKVDHPEKIDFTLPEDHPQTKLSFAKTPKSPQLPPIYVGCPKWNKKDLRNFYPKGTKDELQYYATQFNSIELNATFYQRYSKDQYEKWHATTAAGFMFSPKITQQISHYRQLKNTEELVDEFLLATSHLKEKLGTIFLQLNERYSPKHFGKLKAFIEHWPNDVKLAVEIRHEDWFKDEQVYLDYCSLLSTHNVANTIVDTPGRRDMVHMHMTNAAPFIRFVGANHPSDFERIDNWVGRIGKWIDLGMDELYFYIHQNADHESPMIAAYFIEQLNAKLGYKMHVPLFIKAG